MRQSSLAILPIRRLRIPVVALLALSCAVLVAAPAPVEAQTRFLWPDSRFDITKYKHIEACAGVEQRVRDSIDARQFTYYDTLHHSIYNETTPLASPLITATQQCLASFAVEQADLRLAGLLTTLYLIANEDAKAKRLMERLIQSIPADSIQHRAAAIDSGLHLYNAARPPRAQASLDLYRWFEEMGAAVPIKQRMNAAGMVAITGWNSRDTALYRAGVGKLVDIAKSMTEAEWEDESLGGGISAMIFVGVRRLHARELAQELATSTEAFKTKIQRLFTDLVGKGPRETAFTSVAKIGRPAMPVAGDFWFPAGAEKHTYPRQGVVTIVLPVKSQFEIVMRASAVARRLQAAYPELEIVMVAQTGGWFKVLAPPPPEYEAVLIDSMFRKVHKVPGIIGITNTAFWRIPGYDRRRINNITANEENGYLNNAWLIDKEGKLVERSGMRFAEQVFEELIPVLIKRPWVKQ